MISTFHIAPKSAATIAYNPELYKSFLSTATIGQENFGTASEVTANMLINKKLSYVNVSPEELAKNIANLTKKSRIGNDKLNETVDKILKENPRAVEDYKKGKENAIMFLVGQVMRKFPQKVDASKIKASLLAKLR